MMATPHRSASIDALRRCALQVWPGMTTYWIGDLAHQGEVSGHNPDDTTGVRAEMLDTDDDPEVRALDLMVGPTFTAAEGTQLVQALTTGVDKRRLYYVIYRSTIYRRATGFRPEAYGGANHNDHVHVSGHSGDDDNGSDWTSVLGLGDDMVTEEDVAKIAKASALAVVAQLLGRSGPTVGVALQKTYTNAEELVARPAAPPAVIDQAMLKAALLDPEVAAAYAKAVNDDVVARMAQ